MREAVLEGASDAEFAPLMQAKIAALKRWSALHATVDERERQATYAEYAKSSTSGPEDDLPATVAESRRCAERALQLLTEAQASSSRASRRCPVTASKA